MSKPTPSIYLDKATAKQTADDREFCEQFKLWLAKYYKYKQGSIRRFADEMGLATRIVYRQLNGTDPLSDELRQIMVDCMAIGCVK